MSPSEILVNKIMFEIMFKYCDCPEFSSCQIRFRRRFLLFFGALIPLIILMFAFIGVEESRAAIPLNSDHSSSLLDTGKRFALGTRVFPKWSNMLVRYQNEESTDVTPCVQWKAKRCRLVRWNAFLDGLRGKRVMEQVVAVNRYMNRIFYVADSHNYDVNDYWATPGNFCSVTGTAKIMRSLNSCRYGSSVSTIQIRGLLLSMT